MMARRFFNNLIATLVAASVVAFAPAVALASQKYMACDTPSQPDYERLVVAPRTCYLGLERSVYEAQPVSGHPTPAAVELQGLRWTHWGQFRATARGRSCFANEEGETECRNVVVTDSRPERILPAGSAVIYQLMRVYYAGLEATDWYRPGVDY
jgi:hypothetical protein